MSDVRVVNTHRRIRCPKTLVVRGVRMVLRRERRKGGEISVVCVTDGVSRRMNRRYLQHDYATDVISFSLGEGSTVEGELYVNLDRAQVQARRYGVTATHELLRLVVHGTLHVLGYDDRRRRERDRMRRREDRYVEALFPGSAGKGKA